jgi:hypothetical protein
MNILIKIKKKSLIFPIGVFIIFFLFIYITQPAGIFNMNSEIRKLILILLLGTNYSIIAFFQSHKIKQYSSDLNKWKKILILFGIIAIIVSVLILYIIHPFMTKNHFLRYLFTAISIVTIFQTIIFYIFKSLFYIKEYTNENKYYTFYDNNTTFKISAKELLFIKASGNYIEIFEKDKVHLIRSTLKKVLENSDDSDLIRCHKSYIINKNKIQTITGNTKGYKLKLKDYKDYLPISKNIGEELKISLKK